MNFVSKNIRKGNIFVSYREDKTGKKLPVIVLLDHGIYKILSDYDRIQYSYLWKGNLQSPKCRFQHLFTGIFTQNEEMIKDVCAKYGVLEYYSTIVTMMMSKEYDDVMKAKNGPSTEGEFSRDEMKDVAQMRLKQILSILERLES